MRQAGCGGSDATTIRDDLGSDGSARCPCLDDGRVWRWQFAGFSLDDHTNHHDQRNWR